MKTMLLVRLPPGVYPADTIEGKKETVIEFVRNQLLEVEFSPRNLVALVFPHTWEITTLSLDPAPPTNKDVQYSIFQVNIKPVEKPEEPPTEEKPKEGDQT